jgi:hypothetical protein
VRANQHSEFQDFLSHRTQLSPNTTQAPAHRCIRYDPSSQLPRLSRFGLLFRCKFVDFLGPWKSFPDLKNIRNSAWNACKMRTAAAPIEIQSIHSNGRNESLSNIKATTVFELADVAYFVQSSPDVIQEYSSRMYFIFADVE